MRIRITVEVLECDSTNNRLPLEMADKLKGTVHYGYVDGETRRVSYDIEYNKGMVPQIAVGLNCSVR